MAVPIALASWITVLLRASNLELDILNVNARSNPNNPASHTMAHQIENYNQYENNDRDNDDWCMLK